MPARTRRRGASSSGTRPPDCRSFHLRHAGPVRRAAHLVDALHRGRGRYHSSPWPTTPLLDPQGLAETLAFLDGAPGVLAAYAPPDFYERHHRPLGRPAPPPRRRRGLRDRGRPRPARLSSCATACAPTTRCSGPRRSAGSCRRRRLPLEPRRPEPDRRRRHGGVPRPSVPAPRHPQPDRRGARTRATSSRSSGPRPGRARISRPGAAAQIRPPARTPASVRCSATPSTPTSSPACALQCASGRPSATSCAPTRSCAACGR